MTKIKILSLTLFIFLTNTSLFSQATPQIIIAYVNSDELLAEFPEKEEAKKQLITLNENYKKE